MAILDGGEHARIEHLGRELALWLAGETTQFLLHLEDRAHLLVGGKQSLEYRLFLDDVRRRLRASRWSRAWPRPPSKRRYLPLPRRSD